MKATGVVRRIDDLGRIVIPKEIRKNFKINEGDSIEVFVDNEGIILKKYSLLDNMLDLATKLVESFSKIYNKNILVTDKERVVVCSKNLFNDYSDKELSTSIKDKISFREEYYSKDNSNIVLNSTNTSEYFLVPIIVDSDSIGSVILVDNDIVDKDKDVIRFIDSILIKNIE